MRAECHFRPLHHAEGDKADKADKADTPPPGPSSEAARHCEHSAVAMPLKGSFAFAGAEANNPCRGSREGDAGMIVSRRGRAGRLAASDRRLDRRRHANAAYCCFRFMRLIRPTRVLPFELTGVLCVRRRKFP